MSENWDDDFEGDLNIPQKRLSQGDALQTHLQIVKQYASLTSDIEKCLLAIPLSRVESSLKSDTVCDAIELVAVSKQDRSAPFFQNTIVRAYFQDRKGYKSLDFLRQEESIDTSWISEGTVDRDEESRLPLKENREGGSATNEHLQVPEANGVPLRFLDGLESSGGHALEGVSAQNGHDKHPERLDRRHAQVAQVEEHQESPEASHVADPQLTDQIDRPVEIDPWAPNVAMDMDKLRQLHDRAAHLLPTLRELTSHD